MVSVKPNISQFWVVSLFFVIGELFVSFAGDGGLTPHQLVSA